jgi:hypothetical protein
MNLVIDMSYAAAWRLKDRAATGIGRIVAADGSQNQTGLGDGLTTSRDFQTRLVWMIAGRQ